MEEDDEGPEEGQDRSAELTIGFSCGQVLERPVLEDVVQGVIDQAVGDAHLIEHLVSHHDVHAGVVLDVEGGDDR